MWAEIHTCAHGARLQRAFLNEDYLNVQAPENGLTCISVIRKASRKERGTSLTYSE